MGLGRGRVSGIPLFWNGRAGREGPEQERQHGLGLYCMCVHYFQPPTVIHSFGDLSTIRSTDLPFFLKISLIL